MALHPAVICAIIIASIFVAVNLVTIIDTKVYQPIAAQRENRRRERQGSELRNVDTTNSSRPIDRSPFTHSVDSEQRYCDWTAAVY
jgi:hypothetical protein